MPIKILKDGQVLSENIPLWNEMNQFVQKNDIVFEWIEGQYRLHSDRPEELPISVDLDRELERHAEYFKRNSLHKELLARAIGIKGAHRPRVVDLTAGLLGDSLLFLSFGCEVIAVERNPVIAFLLESALAKARHPALQKLKLHVGEAATFLESLEAVETLYFDPMFEDSNEKASPRKEMRIFRNLVGPDADAESLFQVARGKGAKRLVVKRPRLSKFLGERPSIEYEGKATRYDVYLPKPGNPLQF